MLETSAAINAANNERFTPETLLQHQRLYAGAKSISHQKQSISNSFYSRPQMTFRLETFHLKHCTPEVFFSRILLKQKPKRWQNTRNVLHQTIFTKPTPLQFFPSLSRRLSSRIQSPRNGGLGCGHPFDSREKLVESDMFVQWMCFSLGIFLSSARDCFLASKRWHRFVNTWNKHMDISQFFLKFHKTFQLHPIFTLYIYLDLALDSLIAPEVFGCNCSVIGQGWMGRRVGNGGSLRMQPPKDINVPFITTSPDGTFPLTWWLFRFFGRSSRNWLANIQHREFEIEGLVPHGEKTRFAGNFWHMMKLGDWWNMIHTRTTGNDGMLLDDWPVLPKKNPSWLVGFGWTKNLQDSRIPSEGLARFRSSTVTPQGRLFSGHPAKKPSCGVGTLIGDDRW